MRELVRLVGPRMVALALLLLTSGCAAAFEASIVLHEDSTADVSIVATFVLDGRDADQLLEGVDGLGMQQLAGGLSAAGMACGLEPGVAAGELYSDDGIDGFRTTIRGVSLEALSCIFGPATPGVLFSSFRVDQIDDELIFNAVTLPLRSSLHGLVTGGAGEAGPDGQKRRPPAVLAQGSSEADAEALQNLGELREELQASDPAATPEDAAPADPGPGALDDLLDPVAGLDLSVQLGITFPGEISDHNATRVERTTAIWDLDPDNPTTLAARGSANPGGGFPLTIVIIAIVAAVVVLLLLFLLLRNRGKSSTTPQPLPGAAPGFGQPGAQPGAAPGFGAPGAQQGAAPGFGAPSAANPGQGGAPAPGFGAPPQPQPTAQPPQPPQPPGQPQQQPPAQPQQPAAQQGGQGGGGFDPGATRTFNPNDLKLPPNG